MQQKVRTHHTIYKQIMFTYFLIIFLISFQFIKVALLSYNDVSEESVLITVAVLKIFNLMQQKGRVHHAIEKYTLFVPLSTIIKFNVYIII